MLTQIGGFDASGDELPIFFGELSRLAAVHVAATARSIGADGYVSKGARPERLLLALAEIRES